MALSAAVLAEIKRKAEKGDKLTNVTAESKAAYRKFEAEAAAKAAQKKANPSVVGSGATSTPAYSPAPAAAAATTSSVSGRDKRAAQMEAFTGWDNNPEVRALQEKHWQIYVDTGRKDTAEQKSLSEQAQKIRAYNNPMYDATKTPYGAVDWVDAEKIFPRETTPNATGIEGAIDGVLNGQGASNLLTLGVGTVAIMFVFSLFRR